MEEVQKVLKTNSLVLLTEEKSIEFNGRSPIQALKA